MNDISTVFVTGGLGFIGSHLVDRLIDEEYDVIVLDDFSSGLESNVSQIRNPKLRVVRGSVLDTKVLADCMKNADAVVHLAAIVSVQRSLSEPHLTHDVNVTGTLNLLSEGVRQRVRKFIFASSAAVYGRSENLPLREEYPVNPLSPYGASKAAAEAYCTAFSKSMQMDTVILRFMNVYGPRRSSSQYAGVMIKFAEAVRKGDPLVIYGDGQQTRDFTYVTDIVDAMILSLKSKTDSGVPMNIGTGKPHTINQLARIFEEIGGLSVQRRFMNERPGEIRSSYGDITLARQSIGYQPKVELAEGVRRFMEWYRTKAN